MVYTGENVLVIEDKNSNRLHSVIEPGGPYSTTISGAEHYRKYYTKRSIHRTINSLPVRGVCDISTRKMYTD